MIPLGQADKRLSRAAAMSGKLDERQALAAIILWNPGHFDTLDIAQVISCGEDAVCRTLHAARHVGKGG
jgi:hypothetical protein